MLESTLTLKSEIAARNYYSRPIKSVTAHMKTDKHCEAAEDSVYFLQKEVMSGILPSTIIVKKQFVL